MELAFVIYLIDNITALKEHIFGLSDFMFLTILILGFLITVIGALIVIVFIRNLSRVGSISCCLCVYLVLFLMLSYLLKIQHIRCLLPMAYKKQLKLQANQKML